MSDAAVERHQLSAVLPGKTKQVDIGDLPRPKQLAMIENRLVKYREIVGPERVSATRDLRSQ